MHSSLPEQLSNFAFSRSRLLRGLRSRGSSALVVRRSRVGHRHLPAPRGDGAGDRRRRADVVLIENAPGSGDAPRRPGSGRPGASELGLAAETPIVLYTGHVRGLPGARPAVRAPRASSCWREPGRAVRAGGRATGPGRQAAASGARAAGVGGGDRLRRRAAGRGDPRVPRRGRRARLAAEPGHEHAAEDLPVPPRRPADRRDAPADAHAGARRRGGGADRPDAGGASRRASSRAGDPRQRRSRWARGASWPRRKYSYEAYLDAHATRRAALHGTAGTAAGRSPGGARRDAPPAGAADADPEHYSYALYADPAMAGGFDALRFGGPIGTLLAEIAGARARGVPRRRRRGDASSTSAPAPGARRSRWRGGAPA